MSGVPTARRPRQRDWRAGGRGGWRPHRPDPMAAVTPSVAMAPGRDHSAHVRDRILTGGARRGHPLHSGEGKDPTRFSRILIARCAVRGAAGRFSANGEGRHDGVRSRPRAVRLQTRAPHLPGRRGNGHREKAPRRERPRPRPDGLRTHPGPCRPAPPESTFSSGDRRGEQAERAPAAASQAVVRAVRLTRGGPERSSMAGRRTCCGGEWGQWPRVRHRRSGSGSPGCCWRPPA